MSISRYTSTLLLRRTLDIGDVGGKPQVVGLRKESELVNELQPVIITETQPWKDARDGRFSGSRNGGLCCLYLYSNETLQIE